jgi:hypothetical protein
MERLPLDARHRCPDFVYAWMRTWRERPVLERDWASFVVEALR